MTELCVQGCTPYVVNHHSHLFMAFELEMDMDFMALEYGTSLVKVYLFVNKTYIGIYLDNCIHIYLNEYSCLEHGNR